MGVESILQTDTQMPQNDDRTSFHSDFNQGQFQHWWNRQDPTRPIILANVSFLIDNNNNNNHKEDF